MTTTRQMIREFNLAFGRPVRNSLTQLTVTERELLGKLLLEETLEYITKGLGLLVFDTDNSASIVASRTGSSLEIALDEGQYVDPVECADGLGDVNVVIHFAAHWQGFNLDKVTEAIHESNMSKLDENGKPIINQCTSFDRMHDCETEPQNCVLIDPTKPRGKILKPSHFRDPIADIIRIIMTENGNG